MQLIDAATPIAVVGIEDILAPLSMSVDELLLQEVQFG